MWCESMSLISFAASLSLPRAQVNNMQGYPRFSERRRPTIERDEEEGGGGLLLSPRKWPLYFLLLPIISGKGLTGIICEYE